MLEESYEKLLQEAKNLYFSLGAIPCVCMDNQLIYFNQDGLRHFLRRGRKINSGKTIKIVVGKLGSGNIHFVSIMDE